MKNIKTIDEYADSSNVRCIKPVICILGADGQLGKEFIEYLDSIEYKNFVGFNSSLDITNKNHIKNLKTVPCGDNELRRYPNIIINCAAYNDVYKPEKNKKEQNKCFKTNALGPKYLAEFCKRHKIKLVHFSTNYVFKDSRCTMRSYSEFDEIDPFIFYGFSKYCGENFVKETISDNSIIIRTSWLYNEKGKIVNFIKNNDKLEINNAIGNPTYTLDLVKQTLFLLDHKVNGLYHCVNTGTTSKKQYIDTIVKLTNSKLETVVKNPGPSMPLTNFMLEMENLNIMRPWEEAMQDCFKK